MPSARISNWLRIVAAVFAFASLNAHAISLPGPMVDAKWLHAHVDQVIVVDVRAQPQSFTTPPRYNVDEDGSRHLVAVGGHIPGARLVDFGHIRTTRRIGSHEVRFLRPTGHELQSILRDAGVDGDKPLVIVSPGDNVGTLDTAARMYWTLKTFGSEKIAILNGGMAAWLQAGYDFSTDRPELFPGDWTAQAENEQWTADSAAVAQAASANIQLIDGRPVPQFLGISKSDVVRDFGHIAGARNFPTDAIVRRDRAAVHFMSAPDYHKILPQLGIDANAPSITYCNTGHLAAGAWFVMHEVLANDQTRLYDGSMLQWTQEGRPVVP